MGISEILTKKTGGTPDVTMAKVSETLKSSLDQLLQTKQMESVAEVVKTIVTKDSGNSNPFAGLKEIGIDVKSIMQGDREMAQTALAELHKTREQVIEEKKKNLELVKSERMEELSAQKSMLEIITNMQNKNHEQQLAMLKEMYQDRIRMLEESKKPQEKDQVKTFMETLMIELLREKLQNQPPDPKDQIVQYVNTVKAIGDIFGTNRSNVDGFDKLKYELELKKLEIEANKIKTEFEEKREIEKRRSESINSFMEQLGKILPAAIALIKGGPNVAGAPVPVTSQAVQQPQSYNVICPHCGEEMTTANPQQLSQCSRCGKPISVNIPPNSPSTSAPVPIPNPSREVLDI